MVRYFFIVFFICIKIAVFSQNYHISGWITDAKTGEAIINATLFEKNCCVGSISNEQGYFNIKVNRQDVVVIARNLGYTSDTISMQLKSDTLLTIKLDPYEYKINEVSVLFHKPVHQQTLMGKVEFMPGQINSIPSFVGEPDLIKAAASLPGISSGREGFSSIFVRGGDRGQNLILLDGAKLYNTNHLGGLVSLFNTDVLKKVDIYKGGFPARFGGRSSSVINVFTKDGNRKGVKGKFNLGLLSSGISVDGPLNPKTSFLFAARSSYYDLFTIPARLRAGKISDKGMDKTAFYMGYTFFDINAKINYYATPENQFFVNLYSGHDFNRDVEKISCFDLLSDNVGQLQIYNTSISVGQNKVISPGLYFKQRLTFSNYRNGLLTSSTINKDTEEEYYNDELMTQIKELNYSSTIDYSISSSNRLNAGVGTRGYRFLPLSMELRHSSSLGADYHYSAKSDLQYSTELYAFIEDELSIGLKTKMSMGLRGFAYFCEGQIYTKMEPRFSVRTMLGDNISVKGNYSIMHQVEHVLVQREDIFEREIWLSSTKDIPPQRADQFSFGMFFSIPVLKLNFSVESYYKEMSGLLEYEVSSYADFDPKFLENDIIKNGIGESYGLEVQSIYNGDNVSATLSYTFSKSKRKFDDYNNGNWYLYDFDRPHDLSFLFALDITERITFNSHFVYSSGIPFTFPQGYNKGDKFSPGYFVLNSVNNYRLPDYHRLDIALKFRKTTEKGNERTWLVNVYNCYSRKNAVHIYQDINDGKYYQKSRFPIIPTISYSLKF